MSHKPANTLATGLICVFLAACGGGGAGASSELLPAGANGSMSPAPSPGPGPLSPAPAPAPAPDPVRSVDATQARFRAPQGIAIGTAGELYVADTQNYTIRKIARNGEVTTVAGMPGVAGAADGAGAAARFTEPRNLALDAAGNLYVTDGSTVRKITPSQQVTTIAGVQGEFGEVNGAGSSARFRMPKGVAVDAAGNVFVADSYFDGPYVIRKITPNGEVSTFAGGNAAGSTMIPYDDTGVNARFAGPHGLTIDRSGNLFATDVVFGSFTGSKLNDGSAFIRKITAAGAVTTLAGNHGFTSLPAGGPLALFSWSTGIAVDGSGNIFVTDRFNGGNRIMKLSAAGAVTTVPVNAAGFGALSGLVSDGNGNLYASDAGKHTIGRISASGTYTLVAGSPGEAGSVDTP